MKHARESNRLDTQRNREGRSLADRPALRSVQVSHGVAATSKPVRVQGQGQGGLARIELDPDRNCGHDGDLGEVSGIPSFGYLYHHIIWTRNLPT